MIMNDYSEENRLKIYTSWSISRCMNHCLVDNKSITSPQIPVKGESG